MAYRIGQLSELSGFDTTVLRAWERRHKLLHPERLENGYRLYTENDLALLRRVRSLLDRGYSIGDVVRLLDEERDRGGESAVVEEVDPFDGRHPELSWAILDALPCAVLVTDVRGRVRWANRGVVALCGYDLSELRGQTPGRVLQGPDSDPEVIGEMRAAIAAQRRSKTRILNIHKSGKPYLADVEIVPVQSGLSVIGFVGMTRRVDDEASR